MRRIWTTVATARRRTGSLSCLRGHLFSIGEGGYEGREVKYF